MIQKCMGSTKIMKAETVNVNQCYFYVTVMGRSVGMSAGLKVDKGIFVYNSSLMGRSVGTSAGLKVDKGIFVYNANVPDTPLFHNTQVCGVNRLKKIALY